MPTVLKVKGYRFFFFSREELRQHIHIQSQKGEAKFSHRECYKHKGLTLKFN